MVRKDLIRQREDFGYCVDKESIDWINDGTTPVSENFRKYNITSNSIVFTFDEYQVGPYVEGAFQVELEIAKITKHINPIINNKYLSV
jgi:hypothetical protein